MVADSALRTLAGSGSGREGEQEGAADDDLNMAVALSLSDSTRNSSGRGGGIMEGSTSPAHGPKVDPTAFTDTRIREVTRSAHVVCNLLRDHFRLRDRVGGERFVSAAETQNYLMDLR